MLNNQYFLLITLLPTYLDTSTLKRDNYEVTIYFIWTNLLKQKKWSLSAYLSGGKKNPYPPLSPLFSFIFRYFFYLNLYSFMTRRATKVIFNKIIIVQTIINNKKTKNATK